MRSRPVCASSGCSPRTRRRTTGGPSTRNAAGGSRSPRRHSPGCRWCVPRPPTRSVRSGPARPQSTSPTSSPSTAFSARARAASRRKEHGPQCPPRELGRCPASVHDRMTEDAYRPGPELFRQFLRGLDDAPLHRMRARVEELAAGELFENAARLRDRTAEVVLALRRMQRLAALTALDQLVAARPAVTGGWEFAVIRSGRLASAGCARRGIHPMPVVDALVLTAETVVPDATPLRGASLRRPGCWRAGSIRRTPASSAPPRAGASPRGAPDPGPSGAHSRERGARRHGTPRPDHPRRVPPTTA